MPWTLQIVELPLELQDKECCRCGKFKSSREFYQKGPRLESICKTCKREARDERKNKSLSDVQTLTMSPKPEVKPPEVVRAKAGTYEDYGLTRGEFMEIVEFYYELMKLEKKGG